MLESLAAWVLNTYVGEYVENLNTDQLSIALLQGAVELENLPLKKDALKSLDIPLEVKSGLIGKITLHIPLRRLRSEPWVISIEKLYLVAGPLENQQFDETLEKQQQQDHKKSMLEALEQKWQILRQAKQSDSGSWFSYGASVAANILENIQLNVKDVHLRYEDDQANPSCPFACGITIKKLSVHSTDSTWVPKFVSHDSADIMYKLVDLQSLSFYCDSNVFMLGDLPLSQLADELQREMFRTKDNQFKEHEYILKPINAQARVKRYTSALPLRSQTKPRITVDLTLDQMGFCLATSQYRSLLLWHREFARYNRRRKFHRFRPMCRIRSNTRAWWKFAIRSHLSQIQEHNRRLTRDFLTQRVHEVVIYSRLYADYLIGEILSTEQKIVTALVKNAGVKHYRWPQVMAAWLKVTGLANKAEIEEKWDYEELKLIRERMYFKLRRENRLSIEITKKAPVPPLDQPIHLKLQQQPAGTGGGGNDDGGGGGGLFRSWFPGWSGWYQSTPITVTASAPDLDPEETAAHASDYNSKYELSPSSASEHMSKPVTTYEEEAEIEQEILDVIHDSSENSSFLRKDTVFARMSFVLKTGSFKLIENSIGDAETSSCPLAELQCTTINMEFESRPRTSAVKFSLAVENLVLENLSSKNSVFPYIICPPSKFSHSRTSVSPSVQTKASDKIRQPLADDSADSSWQFFKLVYEKNPPNSQFKYKASVKTQPIDIIYIPALLRRVKEVFTVPNTTLYKSANAVTSWQFEKLRKQTQEELKHTLDELLEGESRKGRWYIDFDISAPKLIVPENVLETNPAMVVMDLGNFRFKTISEEKAVDIKIKTEEYEDFQTPMSTPPNEEDSQQIQASSELTKKDSAHALNLTDATMMERLYEKYKIELTEMQVLIGHLNDNWRHAYYRGTSNMHILDRFSISLQLERRLIRTSDIEWPAATLSGTLPFLTFHLNERKIQALRTCADAFSKSSTAPNLMSSQSLSSSGIAFGSLPSASEMHQISEPSIEAEDVSKGPVDNNLFTVLFCINNLSLEIQSQGNALLELQVTGVQASIRKKPDTATLALTIHSLLVVDALQSYGPDFELLVASHRHVQLDSQSGSIRGSEVNSPTSPQSPSSPASPRSPSPDVPLTASFGSLHAIHEALTCAFHSVLPKWSEFTKATESRIPDNSEDSPLSEALISLEFKIINVPVDNSSETSEKRSLTLQFNSLDFIANQETLVEVLGFLKRTFPNQETANSTNKGAVKSVRQDSMPNRASKASESNLYITATFKRLNVLLLRIMDEERKKVARKVATATMSCAKVQVTLGADWKIEGSLGGLHLLDVVPEGKLFQQVISIGQAQLPSPASSAPSAPSAPAQDEMFKTAIDDKIFQNVFTSRNRVACRFSITKHSVSSNAGIGQVNDSCDSDTFLDKREFYEEVNVSFDMASLTYIHCPKFLAELLDCVSEFSDYMTSVATSIKTAATEVAMGMVSSRGEKELTEVPSLITLKREHSLSDVTNTILLYDEYEWMPVSATAKATVSDGPKRCIVLNARMETPILVIPRTPNSNQVLLAHLGEIVVDNTCKPYHLDDDSSDLFKSPNTSPDSSAKIYISLTNMNLYSLDFDKHKKLGRSLSSSSFSGLTHELGVPILYNTAVDLTICKRGLNVIYINEDSAATGSKSFCGFPGTTTVSSPSTPFMSPSSLPSGEHPPQSQQLQTAASVLDANIKIATPIKLGLSKEVYEQILQTLDNITYDAEMINLKGSREDANSGLIKDKSEKGDFTSLERCGIQNEDVSGVFTKGFTKDELSFFSLNAPVEKSASDPSSWATGPLKTDTESASSTFLAKLIKFQVPLFEVELRWDFGDGEQGLVDLKLYDFAMDYEKNDRTTTHMKLRLKSLQIDDLLEPPESKHRQIMISQNTRRQQERDKEKRARCDSKHFLSTSCPDSTIVVPVPKMPPSLPASFHDNSPLLHFAKEKLASAKGRTFHRPPSSRGYLHTPPPTPLLLEKLGKSEHPVDDLVHIDVVLVDRKQPEFVTKYNQTNRFIDVEFSHLDTTINLQTWVVLLDFLGMGAKVHDSTHMGEPTLKQEASTVPLAQGESTEIINSEIKFRVESFTLILNKSEYELARATVTNLDTQISLRDGNISTNGQLGSLSLLDQSPHGAHYTQRFVSVGKQVMQFKFFKHGTPDFSQLREFDISLTMKMSSVRYVHTNRFHSELVAFCQHFLQLQDVLGRMRAASAGQKINENATRGSRIKLDIEADSPILLIPLSSRTDEVLVVDLGRLRITNCFITDGELGTLRHEETLRVKESTNSDRSRAKKNQAQANTVHDMTESVFEQCYPPSKCDPMTSSIYGNLNHDTRSIGLECVNSLFPSQTDTTSHKESSVDPSSTALTSKFLAVRRQGSDAPFQAVSTGFSNSNGDNTCSDIQGCQETYRCLLDVMKITLADMDLHTARRVKKQDYQGNKEASYMEFTTYGIQMEPGELLREKILLDLHVERNLEGDISHTAPDWRAAGQLSSVYCHLDLQQYKLIQGILAHNLGEKVPEFQRPLMSHLQDPSIQTVLSGDVWRCISLVIQLHNVSVELLTCHAKPPKVECSLARLDFISSRLSFESFSDQSKDVDLVSHEIVVMDTRFKGEPVNTRPNIFTSILQPSVGSGKASQGLQVEMHFRSAADCTEFTILLNNMRVMCIFDWLLSVQEYLLTEPQNPFLGEDTPQTDQFLRQPSTPSTKLGLRMQSPLTVSRGIITKRGPQVDEVKVPFELRLNVSDTQFVVVEDCTTLDTNAVILKSTAVLLYKPQALDKVLSCSLNSMEAFSCCLMAEDDTALSIIDPMTISIELNANPLPEFKSTSTSASLGLLAVPETQLRQLLLEISFTTMNIRVSYHDMVMFLAIINSLPGQALQAKNRSTTTGSGITPSAVTTTTGQDSTLLSSRNVAQKQDDAIERLHEMGFSTDDCLRALKENDQDVNLAALWLSMHARCTITSAPSVGLSSHSKRGSVNSEMRDKAELEKATKKNESMFSVTALEIKVRNGVCLCLIDDCGDADVPLAEISCNAIEIHQTIEPDIEGRATLQLVGDYYNRNLSGWEPFLEPWGCNAEWKQYRDPDAKLAVQILSKAILNVNLTSTLLELYDKTKGSWTQDYLAQHRADQKKQKREGGMEMQRRSRFIPYIIRNDTGSALWFMTATSNPSSLPGEKPQFNSQSSDSSYIKGSGWEPVGPGNSKPFHYHRREKFRHKKTHDMHINQLVVMIDGLQKLSPVSVDKVGIYFRHAEPSSKAPSGTAPARVVLDVKQEGSARKLIVVRSALVLVNKLDSPVELKMENTDEKGKHQTIVLPINQPTPVPLAWVHSRLHARPADWHVHFCSTAIQWQHVTKPGEHNDGVRTCNALDGQGVYRFCVSVLRENYPEDSLVTGLHSSLTMPGHQVTLLPPVTIINLLPIELHYYLRGTEVSGNLKPDHEAALHGVDLSCNLDLGINLENFSNCKELLIPPNTNHYKVKLRVYDSKNRLLELTVRIQTHRGGALRLTIAVPFWLVNKSGLPLVFRQEGSRADAAGQFEEHEQARSVMPLLFSFSDHDEPSFQGAYELMDLIQMRVGKSVHGTNAMPQWCHRFSLDGGIAMRALHVSPRTNRPDWLVEFQTQIRHQLLLTIVNSVQVYNIGIQVKPGRGRYHDTKIVTFAPRFEIDNQSKWKLAIAQKHTTEKEGASPVTDEYLSALPHCKLPFHWPRVDLDQLLCIKIVDPEKHPTCRWSGGFHIDRVDAFHINMREESGKCLLLKVEVVLQGPTFFVVFADADIMPPPFRIDNLTELTVRYHQAGITDDRLKAFLPPHSNTPYAWDEPTLHPLKLQLQIPGGTSSSYSLERMEEGDHLQYENFIYIVSTPTFEKSWSGPYKELVLDCVHGNNIVFKRMEKGKRSQLWRMTSDGKLEHEGSMSPREPGKPRTSVPQGLVLDIFGLAPQSGKTIPLVLRKIDERRKSTQTWRFTEDGMLCCHAGAMCVQAVNGVEGLQDGAVAVLGPGLHSYSSQGSEVDAPLKTTVAQHMLISRQKLLPGSGCLSVRVTLDGPIRVLEIVDIQNRAWLEELFRVAEYSMLWVQKQIVQRPDHEKGLEDWEVYDKVSNKEGNENQLSKQVKHRNLEISLSFHEGIGLSLVNNVPEELVFITLRNIQVEIISHLSAINFSASVAEVQVDSQLFGAGRPVMLYMTPMTRRDIPDNTPTLLINASKVPSAKWNAEIFKHLYISTKRMTVHLEERLLWKLLQFAGFKKDIGDVQQLDGASDTYRPLTAASSIKSKHYYFGRLKISTGRVTLSMMTSSKLPPDLKVIKHALSIPLIAFEEAKVDLDPYKREHPFETSEFLLNDIMQHYTQEIKGQAAKILGSVDFLGNPLGLFNDVTEGISGLIKDGNVGGLVKNVTHGISNTTAKFASTVSDGLSSLSMDDSHNKTREELLVVQSGGSAEYLMAGIKGFGYGLFGGMTSLVQQAYKGTRDEGIEGLIKGVGKGVLGTVTKPVTGVFDLTTGLANAVRDTSRSSSHKPPPHRRLPRCCHGPGGLLPLYSRQQAYAQLVLYELNQQDYSEFLVVVEDLRTGVNPEDRLHALISSRQVFFLKQMIAERDNLVFRMSLRDLAHCKSIEEGGRYYIELTLKTEGNSGNGTCLKKPQVRCDRQCIAIKVAQEIKYAKNLYDEKMQTLLEIQEPDDTDW